MDNVLEVEGGMQLVGSNIEVCKIIVLLLDLDVALGEILVLLLGPPEALLQLVLVPLRFRRSSSSSPLAPSPSLAF
ncbi:MAG: hypothetical protein P8Z49_09130 [Acidobacteriota bacterium]